MSSFWSIVICCEERRKNKNPVISPSVHSTHCQISKTLTDAAKRVETAVAMYTFKLRIRGYRAALYVGCQIYQFITRKGTHAI